jgi:hypothetical protein
VIWGTFLKGNKWKLDVILLSLKTGSKDPIETPYSPFPHKKKTLKK